MYCVTGSPLVFVAIDPATGKCPAGSAVLLSPAEYDAVSIAPTLNEVFKMPAASDLGKAWAAGFILPCTLSLIAWCVASLVKTWSK